MVNIHHVRRTPFGAALDQAEVDAIAAGVRATYVTNVIPRVTNNYTLGSVTATDLTNEFGLVGVSTGVNLGTAAGVQNPRNVALCVSWLQSSHYRGGHPRNYYGGTPQAQVEATGGTWLGSYRTSWVTSANAMLTAINAIAVNGSANLVLVRRTRNGVTLVPPVVVNITGAAVDLRVDSMRRRLGPDINP